MAPLLQSSFPGRGGTWQAQPGGGCETMGFLNPIFLLAAGVLAGPVLLHLLLRNRPERQLLPTFRFLPVSAQQSISMHRFKNWLLLLLRLLIVLLIVIAFARPYFGGPEEEEDEASVVEEAAVFAVDTSLSMRAGERWQTARNRVHTLLHTLPERSRVALLTFDTSAAIVCPETDSADQLRRAVDDASPGYGGTDLLAAIKSACDMAQGMEGKRKRVFMVSDFQRTGFRQLTVDLGVPPGVSLEPVAVAEDTPRNATVAAALERESKGDARVIRVRVRNHGPGEATGRLSIHAGGTELAGKRITVEQDTLSLDEFELDLPTEAGRLLTARFAVDDGLAADNELLFPVYAHRRMPVLVCSAVSGSVMPGAATSEEPPPDANPYLVAAMAAFSDRVASSWTNPDSLAAIEASEWDLVVVDSPGALTAPARDALLAYARAGGKLVVFPDVQGADALGGLAGFPLETWTRLDAEAGEYRVVSSTDFESRLAMLNDTGDALLGHPRAYRYLKGELPGDLDGVATLVHFDDATPFLLERREGAGLIYLFTTPLDPEATDLVLRPAFSPFLYQLFLQGVETVRPKTTYTVGETFAGHQRLGEDVLILDPDGEEAAFTGASPFTTPGRHTLRQGGSELWIAVRIDPEETDLRPMDQARIDLLAVAGNGDAGVPLLPDAMLAAAEAPDAQWPLWWYLLAAAALMMAVESLVAARTLR